MSSYLGLNSWLNVILVFLVLGGVLLWCVYLFPWTNSLVKDQFPGLLNKPHTRPLQVRFWVFAICSSAFFVIQLFASSPLERMPLWSICVRDGLLALFSIGVVIFCATFRNSLNTGTYRLRHLGTTVVGFLMGLPLAIVIQFLCVFTFCALCMWLDEGGDIGQCKGFVVGLLCWVVASEQWDLYPFESLLTQRPLNVATASVIGCTMVLLQPIYQEIFFRGFLLRFLQRFLASTGSILLTSLLLGIFKDGCLIFSPYRLAWNSLLGYFYLKTGHIGVPIGIHMLSQAYIFMYFTFL